MPGKVKLCVPAFIFYTILLRATNSGPRWMKKAILESRMYEQAITISMHGYRVLLEITTVMFPSP